MHIWKHLKTITKHRHIVMGLCFRIGLYRQGLVHDLSKYGWTEFSRSARYYQGFRSPNNYEREMTGISQSWLHHKGRNKHHFEYWLDYDLDRPGHFTGMLMPRKYVAEMFCDRVAASRIYGKENYTDASPVQFFYRGRGSMLMHEVTRREIGYLLTMLSLRGLDETLAYIRNSYLKGEPIPETYALCRDVDEFNELFENNKLSL